MQKRLLDRLPLHSARMEVLLAELLDGLSVARSNFVIKAKSVFKRGYARDILAVRAEEAKPGKKVKDETVIVEVSRNGFYDMLPEALFHKPDVIEGYKSLDQRVQDSEKVRDEERQAREFFLPLEQEFFRQRIRIEQEERDYLSGFANPMQHLLIERFWTNIRSFSEQQKSELFYLLPLTHRIAGDLDLTERYLSVVLKEPVRITSWYNPEVQAADDLTPALGTATLGLDFVMGRHFPDEVHSLQVTIGPVPLETVPQYLEGGQGRQYLETLFGYLLPAEMEVTTELQIIEKDKGFTLVPDDLATSRLGYSTIL